MLYYVAQGKVNKDVCMLVLHVTSSNRFRYICIFSLNRDFQCLRNNIILEVFKKINLKIQGKNASLCLKSASGMKISQ